MFDERHYVGGRPIWMYEWFWFKYKAHEDPRARKTLMGGVAFRKWLETIPAKYEKRRLTEDEIERIYTNVKENNRHWRPEWENKRLLDLIKILTIT